MGGALFGGVMMGSGKGFMGRNGYDFWLSYSTARIASLDLLHGMAFWNRGKLG
jgi:hypothetical protein